MKNQKNQDSGNLWKIKYKYFKRNISIQKKFAERQILIEKDWRKT